MNRIFFCLLDINESLVVIVQFFLEVLFLILINEFCFKTMILTYDKEEVKILFKCYIQVIGMICVFCVVNIERNLRREEGKKFNVCYFMYQFEDFVFFVFLCVL